MKVLNGYIMLHRKILNWRWYSDTVVRSVFIHLLLSAAYKDTSWHDTAIHAGQALITVRSVSEELGLSEKQVRSALEKLKKTGEVTIRTTNRFSIVTIEKWESFQSKKDSAANGKSLRGQTEENQQANGGQAANIINNNKNKKNKYYNYTNRMPELGVSYDIDEYIRKADELPEYRRREETPCGEEPAKTQSSE